MRNILLEENKTAIIGSRDYDDYFEFSQFMKKVPKPSLVVSGGAKGADSLGFDWAKEHHVPTLVFYPEWDKHGKAAGFKRNVYIIDHCDCVVAAWNSVSKGTMHSINLAISKRKKVFIFPTALRENSFNVNRINGFQDQFSWLSNMWFCNINVGKYIFLTSESAYQASKFYHEPSLIKEFLNLDGITAKQKAKEMNHLVSKDFHRNKLKYMKFIIKCKFKQNEYLKRLLLLTENAYLEETNTWNDTYWGVCNGEGENNLGKILMSIREELNYE